MATSDDYVLLVEPDQDLRDTLVEFLYEEGYASCAASTGAEALSFLEAAPTPCLVLLDESANGDGAALLTALRALPGLALVPVCALSNGDHAPRLEVDGVMRKPIDVRELLKVLEHWGRKGVRSTTAAPS
jgi:CheY-like chemotaxis protein